VKSVSTRDITEELAEDIVPDGLREFMGRIAAALLLIGPTCYEHRIEKPHSTGCMFTSQPSFLGPSWNRKNPSLSSISSYVFTCSNLSASRVPSSSCLDIASDRAALEPPRPRPRCPLNELLPLEPRKNGRDLVFERGAIRREE
jgi:hypothetical protein